MGRAGERVLVFLPGQFLEFYGPQRHLAERVLRLRPVSLPREGYGFTVGFPRRLICQYAWRTALCQTPEEFKAWSQNLGHEGVLTTFYSYGAVGNRRQGEIIGSLAESRRSERPEVAEIAKAVARELRNSGPIE